jgi:hypothetical protein
MLPLGENHGKMDMPTKMVLVLRLNGLKRKIGWHHHVLREKVYKPCQCDGSTLRGFGTIRTHQSVLFLVCEKCSKQ